MWFIEFSGIGDQVTGVSRVLYRVPAASSDSVFIDFVRRLSFREWVIVSSLLDGLSVCMSVTKKTGKN